MKNWHVEPMRMQSLSQMNEQVGGSHWMHGTLNMAPDAHVALQSDRHVPVTHSNGRGHGPQVPPHPSSPHCLPVQSGVQPHTPNLAPGAVTHTPFFPLVGFLT
jgi:hypothetical protein